MLHNFQPPTTDEEIRAAALQYVRKVSGLNAAPKDADAFERAVAAIANATADLLNALPARGTARTREGEREKARAKWNARVARG